MLSSLSEQPPIEVKGLTHAYGARMALRGVDFFVRKGEIFGLLGPNGGGKTTVFRILSTLLPPTAGSARVFGLDVVRDSAAVRRRIGVVFQSPSLDRKLTVMENLGHQGHLYGLRGKLLRQRMGEMLGRVGLLDRSRDLVEKLSGGLQRRVEIAKGLLHGPDLLLLDEPSSGLDPGARRDLWQHLQELRQKQGLTVLLTTHFMEEAERCDRLGILHRGELVALDTPSELKQGIGGDVITLETEDPVRLRDQIQERFGGEPTVLNGMVRIESRPAGTGHELSARLVQAFPGQVSAVTIGKPHLEDVFIQRTGHRFWEETGERAEA